LDSWQSRFDFGAVGGAFFPRLHRLHLVVQFLDTGASIVSPEQLEQSVPFISLGITAEPQPRHEVLRSGVREWLVRSFLRDAIEITGLFLDECLQACAIIDLLKRVSVDGAEVNTIFNDLPARFHRFPFPKKITRLREQFGIQPNWSDHVLSLNRARACLVHRLGTVSEHDIDDKNELVIVFRALRATVREIESGKEQVVDRSGFKVEAESEVKVDFYDHVRRFSLGEQMQLTPLELHSTIVTLTHFGMSCLDQMRDRMRGITGDDRTVIDFGFSLHEPAT
jgi:hypothetical protein